MSRAGWLLKRAAGGGGVLPPLIDIEETYGVAAKAANDGAINDTRTIVSLKNVLGADTDHFESTGTVIRRTAAGYAANIGMGPYIATLSDGKRMRITAVPGASVNSNSEFQAWGATDAPGIAALQAVGTIWVRDFDLDPGINGNFGTPFRRGNYTDGAGENTVTIRGHYSQLDAPERRPKIMTTVQWSFRGIALMDLRWDDALVNDCIAINAVNGSWPVGHIHITGCRFPKPERPWEDNPTSDAFYATNGEVAFANGSAISGSGTNVGRIRLNSCESVYCKSFCRFLGTEHADGAIATNCIIGRYWAIAIQFSVNTSRTPVPWEINGLDIYDGIAKVLDAPPPPNNPHPDKVLGTGAVDFTGDQPFKIRNLNTWQTAGCRGDVGPDIALRDMRNGSTHGGGNFVPDFAHIRCMGSKGGAMLDLQNCKNARLEDVVSCSRGVDGDPLGTIVCGGTGAGQTTAGTHVLINCYAEGYSVGGTPTMTNCVTVSNNTLAAWQAYFPNINFAPADKEDLLYQLTPA